MIQTKIKVYKCVTTFSHKKHFEKPQFKESKGMLFYNLRVKSKIEIFIRK